MIKCIKNCRRMTRFLDSMSAITFEYVDGYEGKIAICGWLSFKTAKSRFVTWIPSRADIDFRVFAEDMGIRKFLRLCWKSKRYRINYEKKVKFSEE